MIIGFITNKLISLLRYQSLYFFFYHLRSKFKKFDLIKYKNSYIVEHSSRYQDLSVSVVVRHKPSLTILYWILMKQDLEKYEEEMVVHMQWSRNLIFRTMKLA